MPKKPSNKKNRDKKPQRPYVGDYGVAIESGPTKVGASFGMIVLSVLVGFLVGFIAWGAYRLALALPILFGMVLLPPLPRFWARLM